LPAGGLPDDVKTRAWRYAVHTWIFYVVAVFCWSKIGVFFIELFWPVREVGLFSASFTFASLAAQGPILFLGALIPHFAALSGAGDIHKLKRTFASAIRLTSLLLFPICAEVAALTPELLPIIYGPEFISAVPTAIVLVLSATLTLIFIGNSLLQGLGHSNFLMLSGLSGAFVSILAYLALIPTWGSLGAAGARFIGQTFVILIVFWFIRHRLDYFLPFAEIIKMFFSALVCGFSTYFVMSIHSGPLSFLIAIPLGVTVYLVCIRWSSAIKVEDLASIRKAIIKFPNPARIVGKHFLDWISEQ
jgi:O-antigen/teichoic acid export membrane protein